MQHTALRSSCRPFAAIQGSHRRICTAQVLTMKFTPLIWPFQHRSVMLQSHSRRQAQVMSRRDAAPLWGLTEERKPLWYRPHGDVHCCLLHLLQEHWQVG